MKARKTIEVHRVKEMANAMLANERLSDEVRDGVTRLLERVLFESNAYRGFNYVNWMNGGCERWCEDARAAGYESLTCSQIPTRDYCGPEHKRFYY